MPKKTQKIQISNNQTILARIVEEAYPITFADWNRIKKMIKGIKKENKNFLFFASICLGLFTSSLISLFSILCDEEPKEWFKITIIILTIASFVGGISFYYFNKIQCSVKEENTDEIIKEMEEIEKLYDSNIDTDNSIDI